MRNAAIVFTLLFGLLSSACPGSEEETQTEGPPPAEAPPATQTPPPDKALDPTAEALDAIDMDNKGIGPINSVELGPVDPELASEGEEIFEAKCTACHKIDSRYVGPALSGVTTRRSPEWIMNMMLNPGEMLQRDPIAKALLAEYNVPMTFQNLTEDAARALLEYFRVQDEREPTGTQPAPEATKQPKKKLPGT